MQQRQPTNQILTQTSPSSIKELFAKGISFTKVKQARNIMESAKWSSNWISSLSDARSVQKDFSRSVSLANNGNISPAKPSECNSCKIQTKTCQIYTVSSLSLYQWQFTRNYTSHNGTLMVSWRRTTRHANQFLNQHLCCSTIKISSEQQNTKMARSLMVVVDKYSFVTT